VPHPGLHLEVKFLLPHKSLPAGTITAITKQAVAAVVGHTLSLSFFPFLFLYYLISIAHSHLVHSKSTTPSS